jgi:cytochrome c556
MKTKWIVWGAALLLAAAGMTTVLAQAKRGRATKEFMRDKLEVAQKVLEGIAMEDFDAIAAKAQRLSAMSQEAPWQVFENPDYAQHSATFRRQADALVRSAKDKNIDGATLAYVRLTMSCVDCHKFVRGKLVAQTEPSVQTAFLMRAKGQ